MKGYRNVVEDLPGHFTGEFQFEPNGGWYAFSGDDKMMRIRACVDEGNSPEAAMIWRTQDGYGEPGFNAGDWSGIRDSSKEAKLTMLVIANRWASRTSFEWPWKVAADKLKAVRETEARLRAEGVQDLSGLPVGATDGSRG